jgi:hypothetical protein
MVRAALLSVLFASTALAGTDEPQRPPDADPFTLEADSSLKMTVSHLFDRAMARERVGYLLEYWARRFGVKSEWRGDRVFLTGRVWGIDIRAVFLVQDHLVLATAHDPGTWLASSARDYVHRKLRKYLHPTYDEP